MSDEIDNYEISTDNIPKHIAMIMDGNGRWAKKRGFPRVSGHKEGMNNVKTIAIEASSLGVKVLTLYAFSTENWGRPNTEVNFLMKLPIDFFGVFVPDLMANNIKVLATGILEDVPQKTRDVIQKAIDETKDNTGMVLNFAFNYGGRSDILQATKKIANDIKNEKLNVEEIDDDLISNALLTSNLNELADPDLLIRTSGETRISNFMLWQMAYTEMIFDDILWPDYSPDNLREDIYKYQNRDRRFGKIK
ncbi:isoprenyl transferase [Companilactobacillus sp. RD055328]|uniref:isoprenyl transferase n=1 Tax=Companilactobacillus sp. RD055328 TaxID=2916634 RepID=UPI001FC88A21|nr:isoprenyl transferase [Companilactobacillus sp. RD055328]GKQ42606.1 isoprenyl transferase [Companilactobacillus sp. RD055328]